MHDSWGKEEKGNCWSGGPAEGVVLLVVPELQNIHFVSEGSVSVPSKGRYPDRVLNQETTGLFQEGASFIPAIRDVELLPWRVLQCLMCFFFFP